jgi:hypothetical protein
MIAAMLNDPVSRQSIFILIIAPENMKRMRAADPITLESPQRRGVMPYPLYKDFSILVAYEEPTEELMQIVKTHDLHALLNHLERGREFIAGVDGVEHIETIPHPEAN